MLDDSVLSTLKSGVGRKVNFYEFPYHTMYNLHGHSKKKKKKRKDDRHLITSRNCITRSGRKVVIMPQFR